MHKTLLLLLVSVFLALGSVATVSAQGFHRFGHANRSQTLKAEHSSKHVKHRDKKKVKKKKPKNDKGRRKKEAKLQEERRANGGTSAPENTEPEKTEP